MIRRLLQSVRFRILLLYAIVLLLTLSFFGVTTYVYFERSLWHKIDSLIELKAKGVATSIRTYLKTEEFQRGGWEGFLKLFRQKGDHFLPIAEFLTGPEAASVAAEELRMAVDIFDASGRPIASTSRDASAFAIPPASLQAASRGLSRYYTHAVRMSSGKRTTMRAMVWPLQERDRVQYLIQVRVPLSPVRAELAGLLRILLLSIGVTLLVASWASLVFVWLTLRPVDRVVRTIRGIRADNLRVRIQVPRTADELQRLAETFNELLARLEKSFTAQQRIIQDISHELKTPLTVLRGQIELALKRPRDEAEYRSVLEASLVEIDQIRHIIDGLLVLAKLDSDRVGLELRPLDLAPIAQAVLEDLRPLADSKQIRLGWDGGPSAKVRGDGVYLKRMISNLIENALKYTPPGGEVGVELSAAARQARLSVRDNGAGIAESDLPRIFERFYRASATDGQAREGSFGLGLSIVKSVVELHRGSIDVSSHPGRGTEFVIHLPLA